jgi:hypothetical protein
MPYVVGIVRAEIPVREDRQNAALHADHCTDERVHDDEQRELRGVLAKPEANDGWHRTCFITRVKKFVGRRDYG